MNPPTTPLPNSSSTATRVSQKNVERAVNALLKWRDSNSKPEKPQLLERDEFVYLILTLKKIPPKSRTNAHKIQIRHSLHSDGSELCLIVDDRPKSKLTKEAAMKKIKSENIPISKVIKFSKLKSDYVQFEAKRKLCDSYDVFFADMRVVPLLPRFLGKQFFKKKKIPVPLDLKHNNWKEQIEKVCGSALLYLGTGTCSVLRVGRASMESGEIVENIMAAIVGVAEIVPKKWRNVRSFHLKLLESLALPVYEAAPDSLLKIDGVKYEKEDVKGNEEHGERVSKKILKKGRIHEIQYMDSNNGNKFGSDDEGDNVEPADDEDDEMVGEEDQHRKIMKGVQVDDKVTMKKKYVEDRKKSGKLKVNEAKQK